MTDPNRVLIFDTTLRDGEQSPGCSMTQPEKLRVAKALAELGVDVIEAGFPIASPGDWESVNLLAREVHGPIIAGLARCNRQDIDMAWRALKDAARPRIHVFLATSAIHREYKLNMAKEQIIETAVEGVTFARSLCADVEFSPEDASRTELEFLAQVVEAAIDAGATTINVPDTVGYSVPEELHELFSYLTRNVRNIGKAVLSAHCHNDLDMAVAKQLSRRTRRRTPNRMHDKRHRRTRRQLLARGSSHGDEDPRECLGSAYRDSYDAPLSNESPGVADHRHAHSAQ
jgi:2-isopropylmalate synthase